MNGTTHNGYDKNNYHHAEDLTFSTRAIRAGQEPDQWSSGIVIPPIHLGTTFKQDAPGQHRGFEYGRSGNPSRASLEKCLASLDEAKYGLAFASGLAAVTGICGVLKTEDHIISGDDVYGGTNRYFRTVGKNHGLEIDFVDPTVPENVVNAIKPNTKMIWLENPTNPLLRVTDIPNLVKVVKAVNDKIIIVVDNTFLTPYLQQPLKMGVDIAMYSLTKYMNGHSDVIMGAVTLDNEQIYEKLLFNQNSMGIVPSPFDCFLVNRSLKTLSVRMDRHIQNATEVAIYLEKHPLVESVIFPGLPSHPQYELAKRIWYGPSGMISFYIKGGLSESTAFLKAVKIFTLAESLGGFESLAELPSVMTHASVPAEMRVQLKITDNLIRLSIGLESANDLIDDLAQAFKAASAASTKA